MKCASRARAISAAAAAWISAVPLNPQTWDDDLKEIVPGGYLFYDSTKPMPDSKFRTDIHIIGVPLTAICNEAYKIPRERQLFKNVCYVGALSHLINIEPEVMEQLLKEEFASKPKLIGANLNAFNLGRDWAAKHLKPIGLQLRRADAVGNRIFVEGNNAAALGAVYGGATVCAWYPITPSTSLAEAFTSYCEDLRTDEDGSKRYAIVQAEDEIASIGIVVGAGWNGARAFTCTSGPGISLMNEFIGLSYFAEIPAVIFDVQRGGPSTGMPTRTQQSDLLLAAYASHGDTKHVLLLPADPGECFEMGAQAFDLADRLQTTVFVMLDLDIGMQEWLVEPFKWDDAKQIDRGKVMTAEELEAGKMFGRYTDVDGDAHSLPHLSRHAPDQGRVLHARHVTQPHGGLFREGRRLPGQHGAPAGQVPYRGEARPRPGPRRRRRRRPGSARSISAPQRRPCTRRSRRLKHKAITSTRCACAASRSGRTSTTSSPRTTKSASSNRTATPSCVR